MEPKKNESADLNKKSGLFFNIGLVVSLLVIITAFEWKNYDDSDIKDLGALDAITEEVIDIPLTVQPPPPPPVLQQPEIIEVPDEKEIIQNIEVNLDVEVNENTAVQEVVAVGDVEEEEIEEIFQIAETQPTPEGGMPKFYEYIQKNLTYPEQARRMGIEGKVFVEFIVDKSGKLTEVKALKGIGAGCDEEAVRVVKNAPNWSPGKQRGRAVKVKMVVPIFFKMS
jgi:protein TonB